MPASGVFPTQVSPDIDAVIYGVELLNDAGGASLRVAQGRFFFASKVVLQSGKEPSYALAEVPLASFEENAPVIAGIRGSIVEQIKIGTRARVFVYGGNNLPQTPLLTGSVVNVQQDIGSDGATITIFDDRWLLAGIPVSGQFVYQSGNGAIVYRQRMAARFNPHGRPNCMDSAGGPLFALYPNYGRQDGDSDPAPGAATLAARPWRLSDIAAYLQRTLCTAELAAQTAKFNWFARVDANKLTVPAALAAQLEGDNAGSDARSAAGFQTRDRESGASNKAPDLLLEGLDLLSALTRVVESAGAYALNCSPASDGGARSVLELAPTRFVEGYAQTVNVLRPAGGQINDSVGRVGVIAGQIEEDGTDLFTSVVVCGNSVQIERRVEYKTDGSGAGLQPAWSSAEETDFRNYIKNHPSYPKTATAFLEACWKYPRVYAAYQIPDNYDYLAATKYSDYPRAAVNVPVLPDLLSIYTETQSGQKRRQFPYPVTVELKNDAGAYRACSLLDGLEVDDDGTLWLSAHREAGLSDTASSTWKGSVGDPDQMAARDLRMTLALQADHRLSAALQLGNATDTAPQADPNGAAGRIAAGLQRQYFADAGNAYREHLRKTAWPVPQAVNGSAAASDRAASGQELLTDAARAQVHAQRRLAEVGRVRKTARLVFPSALLWRPGQSVEALTNTGNTGGNYPLRGVIVCVIHDYPRNTTEVELN